MTQTPLPRCQTAVDFGGPAVAVALPEPELESPPRFVTGAGTPEPSSEELAAQGQGGCRASFEMLVGRYHARIFNYLRQMLGNPHDAEDIAQETFLKAYRHLHRYKTSYSFTAWLFTIAKRTAISFYRSRKISEELPEDLPSDAGNPSDILSASDERESLWTLARQLKPKQFEALWLRYGEEFSVTEIARIMKTNQMHVKVLLHRARNQLARRLGQRNDIRP